jgi:hypothetical protein
MYMADDRAGLKERIYGGIDTADVNRKSQRTYEDVLGLMGNNARVAEVGQGVAKGLASGFVDAYYDAYGKLPTEQEVQQFVGTKLSDRTILSKGLQGTLSNQDMYAIAKNDPILIESGEKAQQAQLDASRGNFEQQQAQNTATQRSLLEQLAKTQEGQYVDQSNQQFGQSRGRLLSELASSGRLNTPQATETLKRAEGENQRTLQQALAGIRASQIGSQLGVEQQGMQNIMQGRQFDVGTQQQNKQLGLQRQSLSEQIRQYNEGLAENQRQFNEQKTLAQRLGQLQADANKPGTLDYINTAFGGLSSLVGLGGAIGKLNKGPQVSSVGQPMSYSGKR